MRFPVLPLAASFALLATPVLAQAPGGASARPEAAAPSASAPAYPAATSTRPNVAPQSENLPPNMEVTLDTQRRLKQSLQRNGFRDVAVEPQSYIIHAMAPDGSHIVMLVGPDQVSGVVMGTGSSSQPGGTMQNGSSAPPEQGGTNR